MLAPRSLRPTENWIIGQSFTTHGVHGFTGKTDLVSALLKHLIRISRAMYLKLSFLNRARSGGFYQNLRLIGMLADFFQSRRKIGTDCTPCEPLPPRKMNPLARGWQNYLIFTEMNPYKVQAFTAFLFSGLGNLISQIVVEKRSLDNIDWLSVAKFVTIAVSVSFPILRSWLWVLETVVKPSKFAPLQRMLMDQLLFAPVFLAGFIVLMGFVEGAGWEDAQNRLKNVWIGF